MNSVDDVWKQYKRNHLEWRRSLTTAGIVARLLLSILTTLLNITAVQRLAKRSQRSTYEDIILSLSTADALCGIIHSILSVLFFGEVCSLVVELILGFSLDFVLVSSFFHVILIAVDRLSALQNPIRHRRWRMKTTCHIIIILFGRAMSTITCLIVYTVPIQFNATHFAAGFYASVEVIIVSLYFLVIYKSLNPSRVFTSHSRIHRQRQRKVIKSSVLVSSILFFCTIPTVLRPLNNEIISEVARIFIQINMVLNPLLYFVTLYHKWKCF